jgi:carboxypeptidase Taq
VTNVSAYDRLAARFKLIATIGECASMLGWDAAAVMPPGGGAARGDQLAVLAVLRHAHLTAPEVEADLEAAETSDPWDTANLSLMRRGFARAKALPADLVEAQAKANSDCEKVWRVARHDGDFSLVEPHLAEVLRLTREAAAILASALGLSPYDALMDGYQPGIGADDVAPIFSAYQDFLATALPEVAPGSHDIPTRSGQPAPSQSRRRRRSAATSRNVSGWISTTRGLISRRTRFPGGPHRMSASPRVTWRMTLPPAYSRWCMKPVTRCMSAACHWPMLANRSARRPEWRRTKANR